MDWVLSFLYFIAVCTKDSGKATGFAQAGLPIGIALTMPITTWIIQTWNWQMVFSQKNAGMITGIFTTLGTLAGILAPSLTGIIIDITGNYDFALYIGALVAIAGAVL